MNENSTLKLQTCDTNSSKPDRNATRRSKSPSGSGMPLSTSTQNVFWPFKRVDPRVLHDIYINTKKKQQTDNLNQLGDATL